MRLSASASIVGEVGPVFSTGGLSFEEKKRKILHLHGKISIGNISGT